MSKELFVSSTPHETKVAVVEEDQLNEIYFERENEYTLAGSIYKGRVTRVLPGMQSAFVEIGLERDAFLYVTDFFEPQDEEGDESFETIPAEDGSRGRRRFERPAHEHSAAPSEDAAETRSENEEVEMFGGSEAQHSAPQFVRDEDPIEAVDQENEPQAAAAERQHQTQPRETLPGETHGGHERGSSDRDSNERRPFGRRRRGRRGRGFPDSKFDSRNASRPRAQEEKPHSAPAGYQPIILPGESISKYRNMAEAQTTPAVTARPVAAEPATQEYAATETHGATAATDHETAELDTRDYARRDFGTRTYERYQTAAAPVQKTETSHEAAAGESAQAHPSAHEEIETSEPEADYEEVSRRDTEEIDVAAILDKHRREIAAERTSEQAARSSQLSQGVETPLAEARAESRFGSMPGLVEEEEIEEEEMEQPSLLHAFEDDEYEDFEEEMLDRVDTKEQGHAAQANESRESSAGIETEAASASENIESHSSEDEEEDDELEADSVVEAEMQASGEELAETEEYEEAPAGDETGTRAETRGPSGYQQKVGFDRGRRRRRGGSGGRRPRPQGGGGGRRFHRAPLPQISDLLKEGQEILVQIAKEPIGKKGARITSHIALPGRFLVYMPTVNHNGVSRKIASEEERHRLKRIILSERQAAEGHHGGFIVRTAAAHASEEDLRADIRFLLNLWNEIRSRADSSKSPALIYHDLNLVERILRDQVSEGFSHIWVDNEQEYERIVRFVSRFQPQLVKRVKLYTKETPLFEQFNIQEEINKALKSKVWLKSGGYIVINQTEALVAIDVNTGKFVGKTQKLEDTIVKTNVDAIKEIVRQVRLRDLGGIIVIDFIDMDERRNRQKVMQALEEALKSDRAPSKVLQFNDFGLVAITRKRVKQSLERTLGQPCTYCTGTGLIKSVATVCNEIYVEMRKMSRHLEGKDVFVRVNPEVGKALKANNARWLQ
ncbi:MAG TPA: Rne/Rng family ribonuclease, partial [Terriglobales bacterium]|nr:Rne/Rng family ribonuclease [Terriglobales bacterium]